jgi:hypothetical protein
MYSYSLHLNRIKYFHSPRKCSFNTVCFLVNKIAPTTYGLYKCYIGYKKIKIPKILKAIGSIINLSPKPGNVIGCVILYFLSKTFIYFITFHKKTNSQNAIINILIPTSPNAIARLLIIQTPWNLFESLAPSCAPNNTPIDKARV